MITPAQVQDAVQTILQRQYPRLLNPAFQAVVVNVAKVLNGGVVTGYLVQVRRAEEQLPDGNQYAVLGSYVPVVGDLVECWWRDATTAYVLGSVIPQATSPIRSSQLALGVMAIAAGVFANAGLPITITTRVLSRIMVQGLCSGASNVSTTVRSRVVFQGVGGYNGEGGPSMARHDGLGGTAVPIFDSFLQTAPGAVTVQVQISMDNNGNWTPSAGMLQFVVWSVPIP